MDLTTLLQDFFGLLDFGRLALSVAFVLIAAAISRWQKADLEGDLLWSTVRSFVQLILIGYALEFIFALDHPLATLAPLALMTTVAGYTTASRAQKRGVHHALPVALVSIFTGAALTLSVLVALGVFEFTPQAVIPIGGMVIGNAMTTATLVMTRLADDLRDQRAIIETRLALGASAREASRSQFRRALRSAMVPIIDTTKTVGLIKLPGAMTGMILAGASPIEAVELQIIVMYMLVGANTFTGLSAAYLIYRQSFSPAYQLSVSAAGLAQD